MLSEKIKNMPDLIPLKYMIDNKYGLIYILLVYNL
jgi:hypothetical protein